MQLAGRPMIEWSLAALRAAEPVVSVVVACPPGYAHGLTGAREGSLEEAGGGCGVDFRFVDGGEVRAESVANALAVVETELVAIHDAARPLLTPELVAGVVEALLSDPEADAAICAAPVTDTIKRAAPSSPEQTRTASDPARGPDAVLSVDSTVDRSTLWAAQTPQVFRTAALRRALAADPGAVGAATDEAMLIEAAGGRVLIHPAPAENFKVTTPLDLRLAEHLLG